MEAANFKASVNSSVLPGSTIAEDLQARLMRMVRPNLVPIVRLVDPYMTRAMSEYVALQVLRLHRQDFAYRAQQAAAEWRPGLEKLAG